MIPPFGTTVVKGFMNLSVHSKSVVVEPVAGYSEHIAMARSYGVLRPGKGKIDVCPRNHSAKQVILPKQTAAGEIAPANIILALLVPNQQGMRWIRRKPL